jgi:methionyl-tRNA formyltransferase
MYMNEGLDTGDILFERRVRLRCRETAGSLHDRLAEMAPAALLEALDLLAAGTAPRVPQDNALATYAPKLERQTGRIDWTQPARQIRQLVYGLNPWPGAFTTLPGANGAPPRTLKITRALSFSRRDTSAAPGEILALTSLGPAVATGRGRLVPLEVQLEGKRRMSAPDFLRGTPLPVGTRLGP